MDQMEDGLILLDQEWRIVYANNAARRISRIEPHHINGPSHWELYPETVGTTQEAIYRQSMEQRISLQHEFYHQPFEVWIGLRTTPVPSGIAVHYRNITRQRHDAEEQRRKSEEAERQAAEIETVYRTAPIGLALFDLADFRYLRLNERQAAFFGLKPEEVVGRTLTEMAPIPGLKELFEQVAAGTPVVNYPLEGELISHPGEHRYWTVNYSPVRAPDGTVQAISAASLEITQQKKAEQALIQSEKLAAAGRMATSISHEINNPLEAVTNLLYLIATADNLSSPTREYVQLAQSELARVSEIATQTLRFYRQAVKPSLVTAEQVITPVVELFRRRLANAQVTVKVELKTEAEFECLEGEIRQVLSNLIANAIDAIREGGQIVFRAHDAVDQATGRRGVRITVADNGAGMSEDTRARVFEPFFTTKELNGTGLGLWISAEIVQRHQGQLSARSSQAPHRHGTVFSLFLPLAQNAQQPY